MKRLRGRMRENDLSKADDPDGFAFRGLQSRRTFYVILAVGWLCLAAGFVMVLVDAPTSYTAQAIAGAAVFYGLALWVRAERRAEKRDLDDQR